MLVESSGLSVTNAEAREIIGLYQSLLPSDRQPLVVKQVPRKPARGRFARSKSSRSGHSGAVAMRKCFLSGASPASCPSRSRIVEAICIRLCTLITQPRRGVGVRSRILSRFRAVLLRYNTIRARLHNSQALLEGTDLTLFTLNEKTLVLWYKNASRRDEVRTLMRGASLQHESRHIAADTLPTALPRPTSQQLPPSEPHVFPQPEDTTGKARVRNPGTSPSSTAQPSAPQPSTSQSAASDSVHAMSRTTEWRRRKAEGATSARKVPCCRVCGKPVASSGHTQFRGQRYCPDLPGQIPRADWLAQRRAEAAAKAAVKAQALASSPPQPL